MRVGLDARHVGLGLGIGVFVRGLAESLVALDEVEVVWFGDPAQAPSAVRERVDIGRWPYPLLDLAPGRRLASSSGVNVFHFTGNTGWTRPGPSPLVLTIQDLIFLRTSERDRRLRQMVGHRYERWNLARALKEAAAVAVPSEAVRIDLTSSFPSTPPVQVIPYGVDAPSASLGETEIKRPYVIAYAGRDPRKNTKLILSALRQPAWPGVRLALVAGGGVPRGFTAAAAAELASGKLQLLPFLPRHRLWAVLAGAEALIYPTLDEGFGLPVLEGFAVDVPVISGLAPVTREVGSDAILRIDPSMPAESVAAGVRRILEDSEYAADLAMKGRNRVATFSWERTAGRYVELYRAVAR